MSDENKKTGILNKKLDDAKSCLEVIRLTSNSLLFITVFNFIFAIIIFLASHFDLSKVNSIVADTIVLLTLALLYRKHHTRSLAIIILLFSIASLVFALFANSDSARIGGFIIPILLTIVSVKSLQAAFKLHKFLNLKTNWVNFSIKSAICLILLVITFIIMSLLMYLFPNTPQEYLALPLIIPIYIAYAGIYPYSKKLKIEQEPIIEMQN